MRLRMLGYPLWLPGSIAWRGVRRKGLLPSARALDP